MGSFLDKPVTEKEHGGGPWSGNGMDVALSSMQGWRVDQEDAHVVEVSVSGHKELGWFGVFDGHGGSLVSGESAKRLLGKFSLEDKSVDALSASIHDGFLALDKELHQLSQVQRGEDHSGSTAITCMVTPTHFICGNTGDSRAILIRDGRSVAMSDDHKPYNPRELARIQAAGGTVTMRRVNGDLAVSRALGDFVYKTNTSMKDVEQQVSAEPEMRTFERNEATDQYIVLACDGIWDVMSNDEVAEYVLDTTARGCTDLTLLCDSLIDECLARSSRDNMSVVLIQFKAAPKPSAAAVERFQRIQMASAGAGEGAAGGDEGAGGGAGEEGSAGGAAEGGAGEEGGDAAAAVAASSTGT